MCSFFTSNIGEKAQVYHKRIIVQGKKINGPRSVLQLFEFKTTCIILGKYKQPTY